VRARIVLEHAVKYQRHFDTREGAQRETVLIWMMVRELNRSLELLNADITAEGTGQNI